MQQNMLETSHGKAASESEAGKSQGSCPFLRHKSEHQCIMPEVTDPNVCVAVALGPHAHGRGDQAPRLGCSGRSQRRQGTCCQAVVPFWSKVATKASH